MPSGITHSKASTALAALLLPSAIIMEHDAINSIILSFGALSNIVLTPDLDQQTRSWIENRMMRSKNPLIRIFGRLYIIYFWFYAVSIPHRHWLSHGPIIGTLFRFVYIAPLLVPFLFLLAHVTGVSESLTGPPFLVELIYWLVGLTLADTLHWIMDNLF